MTLIGFLCIYFYRIANFSLKITLVTNVKPPLTQKNRLPANVHIDLVLASSALF